jgi:hypothetical protein
LHHPIFPVTGETTCAFAGSIFLLESGGAMSKAFCPDCNDVLHRSHSRSFHEKLIKAVSRQRLYRCHECGWRGWLNVKPKPKPSSLKKRLLPYLLTLLTALLITLLALYYASS